MPNFAIFGERVVRRPPAFPPPKPANQLAIIKPAFLSHPLLKKQNNELEAKVEKPKKIIIRRVVRRRKKEEYRPKFIPNLPDKILWFVHCID
jgi:antitoxin component of MazEF toxin-antitoxin module